MKKVLVKIVKFLAKVTVGTDIDQLKSQIVISQLNLDVLWASSTRVYNNHSTLNAQDWKDLKEVLDKLHPKKA